MPHDVDSGAECEPDGDGLVAQTRGGDFGEEGEGGGADGDVVPPRVDEDQGDGAFDHGWVCGVCAETAGDEEECGEDDEAVECEGSAADFVNDGGGHEVTHYG